MRSVKRNVSGPFGLNPFGLKIHRPQSFVIILLALCLMPICAAEEPEGRRAITDTKRLPVLAIRHFSFNGQFERSDGWGPHYVVEVWANRKVVFWGFKRVRIQNGHHTLSIDEFSRFLEVLRSLDLASMPGSPPELNPPTHYADVELAVDGRVERYSFTGYNAQHYARIRNALEPFLRSLSYRCPIADSQMRLDEYGIDVDYCERPFEFEESFRNGVVIRLECLLPRSPCRPNYPDRN